MRSAISFALFAFAGALFAAPALAAPLSFVVVEARGVNLVPGAAIDGSQPLTLSEGQEVVLISASGRTLKLLGPYNQAPAGAAAESGTDVAAALASLLTQQGSRSYRVGLVRGLQREVVPPQPWLVDVTHAGNRCVREGQPIMLWRPEGDAAAKLAIAPYDRSWRIQADWPAGAHEVAAPASVPFHDDASYTFSLDGAEKTINLISIPATVETDAMRVGWMVEKGCHAQAQALVNSLK
jgi:hypothetical protein